MANIKVLQIHVGNEISRSKMDDSVEYLERLNFPQFKRSLFRKWDIINADSQMRSLQQLGIDVDYGHFSARKSLVSLFKAGMKLYRISKEYDIVHSYWGSTTSFLVALCARAPVVVSFSGSDLVGSRDGDGQLTRSGKVSRMLSLISTLFCKSIITKSEYLRQSVWKIARSRTVVIPNGVNPDDFYPMDTFDARAKLKLGNSDKIILFFDGNGAAVKNLQLAEEVVRIVKKSIPRTMLMVVNNINHHDLVFYYNAADVMLLTSFHEGSNNSLKEALFCNLPVVSVDCGDSKLRLQNIENSYLVGSYEADELAEHVLKVLRSGRRSNGHVQSKELTLQTIAERIVEVYRSILL